MQIYFGGIIASMIYNYGAAILRALMMLDKSKLLNKEYVINRVALYLKAKQFVDENFKGF